MRRLFFIIPALVGINISKAQQGPATPGELLKSLEGKMSCEIWRYTGTHLDQKSDIPFTVNSQGKLKTSEATWSCRVDSIATIKGGGIKFQVRFKMEEGSPVDASAAISFHFAGWDTGNYVMIPGVVYDGNRFPALKGGYMPPYPPSMFFDKNVPLTFSDDPRLALHAGDSSEVGLLSWNATSPAMSFYSKGKKSGFVVLTGPKTNLGMSGLFVEESDDRTKGDFSITAPGVRKSVPGFGGFSPSRDKPHKWQAGDEVTIQVFLYTFGAKDIPSFLEKYLAVRKARNEDEQRYYVAPMSTILNCTIEQVDKNRYHETPFGSLYFPEGNAWRFQLGWVGGMMSTYPMLALNDTMHLRRVANTIDFVVNKMQGKSGYFYGVIDNGKTLVPEKATPEILKAKGPEVVSSAMVRKNADALFWFFKQFALYNALGHADLIKPEWETAARKLADAFVKTWKQNGDLGQYVDPESGTVVVYNSTAGAIAPAALALASSYLKDPAYLDCALQIANSYYYRFTKKLGLTSGCCGDISQDADSETSFALLESFMTLYRATKDTQWLEDAKAEAALCSTWVIAYNYEFPPGSDLYICNAHTDGGVWASTQNKHGAPGICTSSGDDLFRLYRATGDRRYATLIQNILDAHTDVVELPNRPTVSATVRDSTRGTKLGNSMERIQISDAEGKGAIGKLYNGSNGWTELNGELMSMELPGIYLQTDNKEIFVFDQVKVTRVNTKDGKIHLSITNPTNYDATVSIFAESSNEAKKPLDITAFLHWRKVQVAAGANVEVEH